MAYERHAHKNNASKANRKKPSWPSREYSTADTSISGISGAKAYKAKSKTINNIICS